MTYRFLSPKDRNAFRSSILVDSDVFACRFPIDDLHAEIKHAPMTRLGALSHVSVPGTRDKLFEPTKHAVRVSLGATESVTVRDKTGNNPPEREAGFAYLAINSW